jgi:hypothetical protein
MMGNANAAMPPTQEFQGSRHGVKLPAASLAAEYHGQAEQPPIHGHDPTVANSRILFVFLNIF